MLKQNQDDSNSSSGQEIRPEPINLTDDPYSFESIMRPLLIQKKRASSQFLDIAKQCYDSLTGTPQQKCRKLLQRLQKNFFRDKKSTPSINVSIDFLCPRREPFYQLKDGYLLGNQIILYGVEFLKKKQIYKFFGEVKIESIDLSHYKITFQNSEEALNSIKRNARKNIRQNQTKLEPGEKNIPKGWIEMNPYSYGRSIRRLLARFATKEQENVNNLTQNVFNIAGHCQKVFQLKKKQKEQIQERENIRTQTLKRSNTSRNFDRQNNKYLDNRRARTSRNDSSQNSYSIRRGERSRSREKQNYRTNNIMNAVKDQDNLSVISKTDTLRSLISNFANANINDQNFGEISQQHSDLSFVLKGDFELQKEMQERFNHNNQLKSNDPNVTIYLNDVNDDDIDEEFRKIDDKNISFDIQNEIENESIDEINRTINMTFNNINNLSIIQENENDQTINFKDIPQLDIKDLNGIHKSYERNLRPKDSFKKKFNYSQYVKIQQLQQQYIRNTLIPVVDLTLSDDEQIKPIPPLIQQQKISQQNIEKQLISQNIQIQNNQQSSQSENLAQHYNNESQSSQSYTKRFENEKKGMINENSKYKSTYKDDFDY